MSAWLDPQGRLFNPGATLRTVTLPGGQVCCVIDDALAQPEGVVAWAASQAFQAPDGYPYPGVVLEVPPQVTDRLADFFAQHVRSRLGGRRTLGLDVRLSMVTTRPADLEPRQWLCHRDRVADDPSAVLFAASVLYLFRDPAMGGTSFYEPKLAPRELDRLLADSQMLDAKTFAERYGLQAGYTAGSNRYFERVAQLPAAWNRMIFYDGGIFHSADVTGPDPLCADPRRGRLTLNAFITCSRRAR